MARRNADGEMFRLILWPDTSRQQILGPYDKLSTARGVVTQKVNARFGYSSEPVPWKIEKAMTVWSKVEDQNDRARDLD